MRQAQTSRTRWIGIALAGLTGSAGAIEFEAGSVASGEPYGQVEVKAEPALAVLPDGRLLVAWQDLRRGIGGDVRVATAASADAPFLPGPRVNDFPPEEERNWAWNHALASLAAAADGTVYAVWMDRRPSESGCSTVPRCDTDVYGAFSTDGGVTWSPNRLISDDLSRDQAEPRAAVDAGGRVHVVWTDSRQGPGESNTDVAHAWSDDGGVSWSAARLISPKPEWGYSTEPSLAVLGDVVAVAWTDDRGGDRDVYFAVSPDRGASWSQPVRVDDGPAGTDQRAPEIVLEPGGATVVVWQDHRPGNDDPDVRAAVRPSTGGGFGASVRVNDDLDPALQDQPVVALDAAGHLVVAYRDFRNGPTDPDVYVSRATAPAPALDFEPAARAHADHGGAHQSQPALARCPATGDLVIAWREARTDGRQDVVVARSAP